MFRRTLLALFLLVPTAPAQKEYGFDNRKPSGQPYLTPEESVRRMKVADGFEVKLFAAEPMVVNPVAMTVDERGRVWVIECFEYPSRTPPGKMPRDRIVILEDTKGTGVCDKRTVFCEGKDIPERFDLATGLEVGHGGVFVGAAPHLWFIENKNDKPGKVEKLLTGFGSQDTHETLNTFQWGPDGWLYGLHGIYTQSKVQNPEPNPPAPFPKREGGENPRKTLDSSPPSLLGKGAGGLGSSSAPVELNAGMWRYHPVTRKFEIVAEGTSNPWGWDYRNTDGQMIVCCCVIPHLFHFVPGGVYKRQSGQSANPYAYGFINEICDHTFHKESGWAHAGLLSLDTPLMPPELRDSVIFGSIHGCSIKRNVLKRNGSTFTASRADDFLVSGDKNFRPINLRWGPNGEIYVIDWHDQNPCHQAAAGSWDYEHGRVYRIQKKGAATKKAENLGKRSAVELWNLADDPNPYRARKALELMSERRAEVVPIIERRFGKDDVDRTLRLFFRVHALYGPGSLWPSLVKKLNDEKHNRAMTPEIRSWIVRISGEAAVPDDLFHATLELQAKDEFAPEVRLQMAATAKRLGASQDTTSVLHGLMRHTEDAADPAIPVMLWLAYEPKLAAKPQAELAWLQTNAAGNPLITDHILPRAMRRLVATGKADDLAACVAFVGGTTDAVRLQALEGLAEALKGRVVDMPVGWAALQAKLLADPNERVKRLAATLAVNFRDLAAARRALAVAADPKQSPSQRADAIRMLGPTQLPEAKLALIGMIAESGEIGVEALRALAGYDGREIPAAVLGRWKTLPPSHLAEAVNLLGSRREWAKELLAAVATGTVEKTTLNANTVLRLRAFKDAKLNADIERVWGKVRDTPAELNQLIDKMRGELAAGPASFNRGKLVFDNQCAKCHKFDGRGHTVGPELDGAGRDIEYILINVLDPNRVVGQPYFIRRLVLKNGRIEEGLLAAEDPQTITLKGENDARRIFERKDVAEVEVVERSMMPEGLDKAMTVQDFRDLVRYLMADPFVTEWTVAGKPTSVPVTGRLTLPQAGASATASITAPAAMKTRLLLGAAASLRVTLNGREVFRGTPGPAPDQAGVDVELRERSNTIVIEMSDGVENGSIFARFHDPERKLTYPEPASRK